MQSVPPKNAPSIAPQNAIGALSAAAGDDGRAVVFLEDGRFVQARAALLRYFDEELLDLRRDGGGQ